MKADKKATVKTKKQWSSAELKKVIDSPDASVSVFTKTTNPKVIIESEHIKEECHCRWNRNKHKLLKFLCMMIMCIIVLITFFLSLKTYNTVSELAEYFMS